MDTQHIVTSFDADLAELNQLVARLGALAESQLEGVMTALETRNNARLAELIANDTQLDDIEYELNERVVDVIALRSPIAQDLRRVIVALKVSSILERIGDYAKNIAKRASVVIAAEVTHEDNVNLSRMGALVQQMLHQVLDAYATNDHERAMDAWERDAEVDLLHTEMFRVALHKMSDNPEQVAVGSHMLFIAKNLERIGDYATGIAEQVYFLNTGRFPTDDRPKQDTSSTVSLNDT